MLIAKKVKKSVMEIKVVPPFFPLWAQKVADVNNAFGLKLLMLKIVDVADLSEDHNGFFLWNDVVEAKLIPYLTDEEREKASFHPFNDKERRDGEGSSLSATRNYDGLNVSVYAEGGWRVELLLKHNDRSGYTVLKERLFCVNTRPFGGQSYCSTLLGTQWY